MAVDLSLVALAFLTGYYLRNQIGFLIESDQLRRIYSFRVYVSLLPIVILLWLSTLHICGAYTAFRGRTPWNILGNILKAGLLAMTLFAAYAFLFKLHYLSRTFIVLVFLITAALLMIQRLLILALLHSLRVKGFNYRYILIVGTGPRAQTFIEAVRQHREWGFKILGLVDDIPEIVGTEIAGCKVLGLLRDLPEILEKNIVDDVVFVIPRSWLNKIEEAVHYCEQTGKRVSIAVDLFTLKFATIHQTGFEGFPLLMFQSTSDKVLSLGFKRLLDFLMALAFLIALAPFYLLIAVLIKMSSPGPVFFKQVRASLNGRVFTLYKFRTMVADAEKKLESLRGQNEMSGPVFKMTRDPRVTGIGKWLRKFSLDELPQLWNILMGDMSFVGPRPPIPDEVRKYEPWHRRRLSMRPGLTCLWQIKGRNKIVKFEEWMKLDLEYIDNWSLWLDLKLFLKTIPVVLTGSGAK